MFTDFLIFKILIVIFVLAVLLISFYFTLIFTLKAFKKEPQKVDHDDDDFDYHYDQLEDHKKLEQKYYAQLTELKNKLEELQPKREELEKKYESGIFFKKHQEVWKTTRNLYEDLNRWKNKPYQIDINDVNLFLEDIEVLFNVLKVEIIRPTLNQTFDAREMKINTTLSNAGKMSNTVAEVIKVGYKIRLKNRYKILSEAIVDIYIN